MKISFVIPCYGSEKTIKKVVDDIIKTVKATDDYEIICVNDCSKDNVAKVLEELALSNNKIKVINFSRNFGQHNALLCGYRHTSSDIVVSLDDDGQTDPTQCYKLIDALNDNVDVAFAKYIKKHHTGFRNFGSYINKKMSEILCDMPNNITTNSYFALKKFVVEEIVKYENPYTFIAGLIFRATKNAVNVEIEHFDRAYGRSGYSFIKLFTLWMNGFTAFSVKPLRISTFMGVIFAIIGIIYAIYLVALKLLHPERLLGYSSLMCSILVIGGMIMIMLGLIGEYIGRIYISLNNSPQYVIKSKINFDDSEN